jgi:O-antigen/teichoic acid export membrane protein
MSMGRHLLRGSGVNLLDHLVKIAAVFYTTPLMLRCLTADGYGSWLLAMNVIGYFLLLDLGVSFASTRYFAMAVGSGDTRHQGVVLAVAQRFFRIIGLAILVCTAAALPLMPWLASANFSTWEVTAPLAICGSITALRFALRMPMILLRAHVRYDLLAWCAIGRSLAQVSMMTYALQAGYGLVGAAVVHGCGDCIELALQALCARRMPHPEVGDLPQDDVQKAKRELFSYSNSILLVNIGDSLRLQVNPLLISKMCSVSEVPIYSIGLRLITMLEDVVNALFGGQILAAFSQLHGAEKHDALRDQFRRVTRLTASFSAWAVGGVAFFGHAFFMRWMGADFGRAHDVMLILALPYALRFMQYPSHSLLYTLNKQQWLIWVNFIGGVVTVILALILGPIYGLNGVVLGTAIEMGIVYLFIMPLLVRKSAQMNPLVYLGSTVLWPGLRALALPALFAWWIRGWLTPDYSRLFLCGAGYALVFLISAPWLAMDADMRQSLWRAIRRQK